MTSVEFAHRALVSTDTLRLYERQGLLPRPARSENGYRGIRPTTLDPPALKAVHDFLRFQITEHRTGGTVEVSRPAT